MTLYEQQAANRRKTWPIMSAFLLVLLFIPARFDISFVPAARRMCASPTRSVRQVNLKEGFWSARIAALKQMVFQGRTA